MNQATGGVKRAGTHIAERLRRRLAELREGQEVARRDLLTLLTTEQVISIAAAWAEQQQLRGQRRAGADDGADAPGQKTRREVCIDALEAALQDAEAAEVIAAVPRRPGEQPTWLVA